MLEKMDKILNQIIQVVNKDSIIYQNSRNWVNSTYAHLDADASTALRRNSAHTGLLVKNDADTIRNIFYANNLLNNLI